MWRSGDNLEELVFSFYHVGPQGSNVQIFRSGGQWLYSVEQSHRPYRIILITVLQLGKPMLRFRN